MNNANIYMNILKKIENTFIKLTVFNNTREASGKRVELPNELTYDMIHSINNEKDLSFKIVEDIEKTITKSKMLGYTITKLSEALIAIETNSTIKVISNDKIKIIDGNLLFSKTTFTSIDLHNVDTSDMENMISMFKECRSKRIDLSTVVTSKVINMTKTFFDCSVEELDISSFNFENTHSIEMIMQGCKAKKIKLPEIINTSKVFNMEGAFSCIDLDELDLTNIETSAVQNMAKMFAYSHIKSIKLKFDTSRVNYMSSMFYGFVTDSLILDSFETWNVTEIDSIFALSKIKFLDISTFKFERLYKYGGMFDYSEIDDMVVTSRLLKAEYMIREKERRNRILK